MPLILAALALQAETSPCPPQPVMPAEIVAWRARVYAPGNAAMIPPPTAPAAAYRAAYLGARKTDWADLCRHRAENARLAALPQRDHAVVFMGDSITEAWQHADRFLFADGWIDRGISGQTTLQMLVRFPADVLALRPRAVHIMAGTNDVAGNTGPTADDTIVANIAAMVTLAKAANIRVVLAAIPPAGAFGWAPALRPAPRIAALNAGLKALAARERITFVDYGTVLAEADGSMKPRYALDGVHPSAAGYAAMAPVARRAVAAALR